MIEGEKIRGIILVAVALIGFSIYIYIILGTTFDILLMKLTAISIVGIIFFIIGWIGITLTTNEKNK